MTLSNIFSVFSNKVLQVEISHTLRAGARMLIGGGGGIFIYSGSAQLISFEINFISKETSWAESEYMNIHPPPNNTLAPALHTLVTVLTLKEFLKYLGCRYGHKWLNDRLLN